MRQLCSVVLLLMNLTVFPVYSQNPFLPLWEHIPDIEPYVFEDPDNPGKYRVYLYGSHDVFKDKYCGRDQVLWSAPVENLTDWRYDGVIFTSVKDANGNFLEASGTGDILYAPDIVEKIDEDGKKTYYFYPNNQGAGREGMVAKSDRPDGPFEVCNWNPNVPSECIGDLRFDPSVFIDDDGKVYAYWGYQESCGAELDPSTMATFKQGSQPVRNLIPNLHQGTDFNFYEASSMRKIKDKYVLIYSRWTKDGEFGLYGSNYTLAYAYSNNPLGPFTYGGTIIDGRGRDKDVNGQTIITASPGGNTHGSIIEINNQWYVFYHRQTGKNEYARQTMVAPIEVKVEEGPEGRVIISEGEYTSEGFALNGLNPNERYSAGIACYYTGPTTALHSFPNFTYSGSYIQPTYYDGDVLTAPSDIELQSNPVVNNTSGSVVGYKYFNFDLLSETGMSDAVVSLKPQGVNATIDILAGSPWVDKGGVLLGSMILTEDMPQTIVEMHVQLSGLKDIKGKQAVYFVFSSDIKNRSICELYDFTLSTTWDEQLEIARGIDCDSLPLPVAESLKEAMDVDITSLTPEEVSQKISDLVRAVSKAHEVLPSYRIFLKMKSEAEDIILNSIPKEAGLKTIYENCVQNASRSAETAVDMTTIDAACSDLENARRNYVVNALPTNERCFDMTFMLINASCLNNDGWNTDGLGNFGPMTNPDLKGEYRGDVFFEKWGSSEDYIIKGKRGIYQVLSGLPNGDYELTAAAFRRSQYGNQIVADSSVVLFINDKNKEVSSDYLDYVTVRSSVTSQTAELGLRTSMSNTANWMGLADVRLLFYGQSDEFLNNMIQAYLVLVDKALVLAMDDSGIYDKDLQENLLTLLDNQNAEKPSDVDDYELMMKQIKDVMNEIESVAREHTVWSGSVAENGKTYYLYNVGLKKFLGNGYGYWGTQAGWNEYGIEVQLESAGTNGNYYLRIPEFGNNVFWGWLNTNSASTVTLPVGIDAQYYMNSTSSKERILFSKSDIQGDKNVYRLVLPDNANKYLCYDADYPTVLCVSAEPKEYYGDWQLVSREERLLYMQSHDVEGNATFALKNPDFIGQYTGWDGYTDYNSDNEWNGQHLRTSDYRGYYHAYGKTFDISQSFEGMPSGTYTLSVNGYSTSGNESDEVNAHLYAGHEATPLQSLYNQKAKEQVTGAGEQVYLIDGVTYYCPDENLPDITLCYFEKALYNNMLTFYYDGESALTVGVRDEVGGDESWTDLTGVRLTYHGPENTTGVVTPNFNQEHYKDGIVYDLTGRRVRRPEHGIYIKDGKKFVVK